MKTELADFKTLPLKDAARQLLATLGYKSNKFIAGIGSEPQDFLAYFDTGSTLNQVNALVDEWKSADLLFQLTDQELSRASSLFTDESVQRGLLKSYVFIAIELRGSEYARSKFSAIARQINRLFPMPVMVMFKHGDRLTIAVINRRRNKLDDSKDVLEKATLIRDIKFAEPHRGHLDILASLALPRLVHPQKKSITDFDTLHAAWEQIFNVELLNERFYRELANWYFWALPQVEFPADLEPDEEKRNATGLIRLLTRLIFCWFLKEKGLIPDRLFHPTDLAKILKGFDPESETSSTFYHAILQNLFFATLNQRMGKDSNGNPYRVFAKDEGFQRNKATYDINNLYRYESLFAVSEDEALALFSDIPFLNGGLFECLDRTEEGTNKKRYLDGFSRNPKKRPIIPDRLFFDSGETADLSAAYGDKKRNAESVTGLISILNRYKFTIVENTPIDQEIALDPELLGKVFENLLASYNEETKTTARKQTGSFYTPRPIVDYMVDESLKAHLARALVEKADMNEADARAGLDILFAYTEKEHAFNATEVTTLIAAIDDVKILDPACGSGAFPMGVLHKLVYLLSKLDRDNVAWERLQIAKVQEITSTEERRQKLSEVASIFKNNNGDYGRKLYLIENCLYGVDIQPIAIQISKLRFFISLVCDQQTSDDKSDNLGIRPLPNLETKFVAADTLIGLPKAEGRTVDLEIERIEKQIGALYHQYFTAQIREIKLDVQAKIKEQRQLLCGILQQYDVSPEQSQMLADWDAFDPQSTAPFFDPQWMFGKSLAYGFDIVIGNPPYLRIQGIQQANPKAADYYKKHYKSATGSFDLYVIFVERGMQLIGKSGILSFINPDKWVNASFGKGIRRFVIDNRNVHKLISFGAHQIFSANTYSSLLWMGWAPAKAISYCKVAPEESKAASLQEELAKLDATVFSQISYAALSDDPWILTDGSSRNVISAIQNHRRTCSDVFYKMFQGIASSRDSVYFLTQAVDLGETWEAFSPELKERIEIEKELVRPLLVGEQVHRYETIRTDKVVVFPYILPQNDEATAELMKPEYIEKTYPRGWEYLLRCSDVLKAREGGRLINDELWYRYIYPKNQALFTKPKLVAPDISLGGNFTFDRSGEFFTTTTLYGYIKHATVWESYEFLLAVMNSKLLWFYLRTSGSVLANGYFRYKPAYLRSFPIPEVSKSTESMISTLVKCILVAKVDDAFSTTASFLEDLIDACVMECYFHEHMAERDLLFHDTLAPFLATYDPAASEAQQREFLADLHRTLNSPTSKIRNRLLRLTADSPDLLAVIKAEGRV